MTHQFLPKIFHDPYKNPPAPPPTNLMYGPLRKHKHSILNELSIYSTLNCRFLLLLLLLFLFTLLSLLSNEIFLEFKEQRINNSSR